MIQEIHIPLLGMNMQEATIVKWRAEDGSKVEKDAILAEIETDKAVHEIPAPLSGFLKILAPRGKVVPVGGVIGIVGPTLEECEAAAGNIQAGPLPEAGTPKAAVGVSSPLPSQPQSRKIKISGIARRIAEKHGVDIPRVIPSDPGGGITKEDVEKFIQARAGAKPPSPPSGDGLIPGVAAREKIPFVGKKRAMAKRLSESLQGMAQMTNWEDVDMTRLLEIKNSGLLEKADAPFRLTLNDFFVKLIGQALKEYPLLNASLLDDQLWIWENINIAVAVAVGEDLVTPVIRNVDRKPIQQISRDLGPLIVKARENRLSVEDISGGTISLTNIGALGANPGTPIIQLPHGAVVGFGAVEKKPVVVNDQIVIRPMMLIAVTVDHRFITGAVSARFRQRLKALLENPERPMLEQSTGV